MIYKINEIVFMFLPFFIVACFVVNTCWGSQTDIRTFKFQFILPVGLLFLSTVNIERGERRHGDGPNQEILFGLSHYLLPIRRFGYYDKHTLNPTTNITR